MDPKSDPKIPISYFKRSLTKYRIHITDWLNQRTDIPEKRKMSFITSQKYCIIKGKAPNITSCISWGSCIYQPLMQIVGDFTIMVLRCKIQFGKHSSIIYTSTVRLFWNTITCNHDFSEVLIVGYLSCNFWQETNVWVSRLINTDLRSVTISQEENEVKKQLHKIKKSK